MKRNPGKQKSGWPDASDGALKRWFYLSILLAVVAAWIQSVWYSFSPMDDYWLIVKKMDFLKDFTNFPALFSQSMTEVGYSANYYRPLLNLTFMTEASLSGGGAWVFHLGNLVIHALNAYLVFVLFRELKIPLKTAMAGSLLFCIHPVNAQAVAWIPGRSDTLMATFFFSSMIFFIRYLKSINYFDLGMALLFFMASLLSKETAIALPVVVAASYLAFRHNLKNVKEWTVIAAGYVLVLLIWYLIRSSVIPPSASEGPGIAGNILKEFIPGIFVFVGKIFLPLQNPLALFSNTTTIVVGVVFTVTLLLLCLKFRFYDRWMAMLGLVWAFVFILPPLLVKGNANEHWMYSSIPGFFVFLSSIDLSGIKSAGRMAAPAFVVVMAGFLIASHARANVYRNYDTFLDNAIGAKPNFAMYYDMRGTLHKSRGDYRKAIEDYSRAIELNPGKVTFYLRRATMYASMNMKKEAFQDFTSIIEIDSSQTTAWFLRANILGEIKNYAAALADYGKYLELIKAELKVDDFSELANAGRKDIPENLPLALNNSAIYHYYTGDYDAALKDAAAAQSLGANVSPSFLDSLRVKLEAKY